LEVKPPKRLGMALELPRLWWGVEKFVKVCFTSVVSTFGPNYPVILMSFALGALMIFAILAS
jgi:hypothetical protein